MTNTIIACGTEEFTLGFELVGITGHRETELETLLKDKSIGIIIIAQEEYDKQSARTKATIDVSIKPIVVILSEEDVKGGRLRAAVVHALGVDVLAK